MKQRGAYRESVSFFEIILCFCVIFIHVAANTSTASSGQNSLFADMLFMIKWLVNFAMPGFIFASALKQGLSHAGSRKYVPYMLGRVRRVYVPYLVWVVIFYIYFLFAGYFKFSLRDLLRYILDGTLVAHFYFVLVIMQFYLLYPVLRFYTRNLRTRTGLPIAVLITLIVAYLDAKSGAFGDLLMWDRVFLKYLAFWIFGSYAAANYRRFFDILTKRSRQFFALGLAAAAVYLGIGYYVLRGNNAAILAPITVLFQLVLIGCLYSCALALERADRGRSAPLVRALHQSTFYVYLSHPLFILIAAAILPVGASLIRRFLSLGFAAVVPSFALGLCYIAVKRALSRKLNITPKNGN
jgi:surface polysaccharide O-acyltransferase-like enzyme